MKIIHTIKELREWRNSVQDVAFVPTMGNLHNGHLSLVTHAKQAAKHVVVSVFVNRIQFGEGEDFDQYPRTLEQDAEKLAKLDVDVLFAPDERELYPNGVQNYFVEPPALQNELCGAFRPNHFRGVTTVVSKLFHLVEPNVACFGKKDYQQLTIIRGMVADLNMNIRIIGVPIERDADGLALSSRNQYLSTDERAAAVFLYQQLQHIAQQLRSGSRDFTVLEQAATQTLTQHNWRVDYVSIRDAGSLNTAQTQDTKLVILAAAHLGKTRLIDNIEVDLSAA
ncbi:MAG: pantoate--beta-alanine ligase [Neisseriaceae bacterium]|nr:pantoate--beta-alanine ligase [Neisseriaceae bacterium]